MTSELLVDPLPSATATMDTPFSLFFDRCEHVAKRLGWHALREYDPHNPEHVRLNLEVPSSGTVLWLVWWGEKLELEIEFDSARGCREYSKELRTAYGMLFRAYKEEYGFNPRLRVDRCVPEWDRTPWTRERLNRVRWKFHEAIKVLAVEPGTAPERLRAAMPSLMEIRDDQLPPPLQRSWDMIRAQVTFRLPTNPRMGTLDATLVKMQARTGAKIAKQIVAISDALDKLSGVPWDH